MHLPLLLNALGLIGEGAEIGVFQAGFSSHILHFWTGRCLHSVDPWGVGIDPSFWEGKSRGPAEHEEFYKIAQSALAPFGNRSHILRKLSVEAAAEFADSQLDFAYLDGDHREEAIRDDIAAWLPKVRSGGILAGHDYVDTTVEGEVFRVKSVVDAWARENSFELVATAEPDWPSWLIIKP